ncbi:SAM-dependent methyltransferase [Zhouia sp. PK063]|uniref:SAM-dependent methyltransferase n=1 Tax=Zhouia sp. PK063 TaxID=3373602 RepID=UPI003796116F
MNNSYGTLYLIPTTLGGEIEPLEVLPLSIKRTIEALDYFIVENEKTARRFIKKISPKKSQPSLKISLLNKYTEPQQLPIFLTPCLNGHDAGIISEAGCPGIADPGADVVKIAHEKGIKVVPLVGPSSILMAMMASGMNGQSFAFNGYLPIDKADRKQAIKQFEKRAKDYNQAQVFIETPYRNNKLLENFATTLQPNTRLCVACDISLPSEFIKTLIASQWGKATLDLHKRPSIFIIQP